MFNLKEITNYFLVILVLIIEVSPFFSEIELPIPWGLRIIILSILMILYFKRGIELNYSFLFIVIVISKLIYLQGIFFGFSFVTVLTYILFTITIPYLLYVVIGVKVFKYLVNVIFYTASLATIIWLLQVLVPPFDNLLQLLRFTTPTFLIEGQQGVDVTDRVSIAFIYTINHWYQNIFGVEILRNAGLYHEPGAFAYFLILALGLNCIIQRSFVNVKNVILTIILLTTFSTAGYLAFLVLAIYAIMQGDINFNFKILAVPVFLLIAFGAFTQFEFLDDKIGHEVETQIEGDEVFESTGGRVRRIRSAINLWSTSPIIGRGIISASRDFEMGSPYHFDGVGIWRTFSSYGILFAPLIYFFYFYGIRTKCKDYNFNVSFAIVFFIAIAIGASAQSFFMDNITMLLLIYGIINFFEYHMNN